MADLAVLDPVQDRQIDFLLERNFTLPLALAQGAPSPDTRQALIAAEVARLTAILVARGHLEARIEAAGTGTQEDPVRLRAVPGPSYRIAAVRIEGLPMRLAGDLAEAIAALRSKPVGRTAERRVIDDLGRGLLFELREASHADAVLAPIDLRLNRVAATVDLILTVDPGPPSRFGEVLFRGSLRVSAAEAQGFVPFRAGDPYSLAAVEALRAALDDSGKFRRIRIETQDAEGRPGVVNLSVRLWDRAQLPQETAPPWILLGTILFLAIFQMMRMTTHWSSRTVRLMLTGPAILLLGGSAYEVTNRLYLFLAH